MKTRQKITIHLVAGFLWLPVGSMLVMAGAGLPFMLAALIAFALAYHHFSPRCPVCGTNVYRTKSEWFGESYSAATVRCSECGLIWDKE